MSHSPVHIRRQAARLLQSAGVSREPVSLRDVVSALNLEVVQSTGEPFLCEGALRPVGDGHAIVVRGASSEQRRRFTIAHEIGHFVLHPGRLAPERGGAVNEAWQLQEREADQFAAELLMPEGLVREAVVEVGPRRGPARRQVRRQPQGHAGTAERARHRPPHGPRPCRSSSGLLDLAPSATRGQSLRRVAVFARRYAQTPPFASTQSMVARAT